MLAAAAEDEWVRARMRAVRCALRRASQRSHSLRVHWDPHLTQEFVVERISDRH